MGASALIRFEDPEVVRASPSNQPCTLNRVHIIGAGLIGTSLAMVLVRAGVMVSISDSSPTHEALAADLSGARQGSDVAAEVEVVIVATPPDVTARVIERALARWPTATVTDVASIKTAIQDDLEARGVLGRERYVGAHPMAGRERSGPISARVDLFEGRPWVVTATAATSPAAIAAVCAVAEAAGAVVRRLTPAAHDLAVAAVSHVPQVVASLVAAELIGVSDEAISLAGQGLRDVTRIAASDPMLWTQILAGNAAAVACQLRSLTSRLDEVVAALEALAEAGPTAISVPGARAALAEVIAAGNLGHARIPGKHGSPPTTYSTIVVLVPDEPGQLARLFHDVSQVGVNLEELTLDHGLDGAFGLLELSVLPGVERELVTQLAGRGWRIYN